MKNLKYFGYILGLVMMMSSCTDVIELELEDPEPVLVIDGYVSNQDTVQYVRLSSLENYFSEQPPNYAFFKDANVQLRENGNTVGTYIFSDPAQRFELQYEGVIGNEYQLFVELPDGSSYLSAAEVMKDLVPIDTIWYELATEDGPTANKGDYVVKINTQEPAGLGDYYQWKTYVNNNYNFLAWDMFFSDDRFVDGIYVVDLELYSMSQEDYQKEKQESPDNRVFVKTEQLTISERYYNYLFLVDQQLTQVGSPFAAPPAEIRGNVYKQGEDEVLALGYFYTATVSTASIELKE